MQNILQIFLAAFPVPFALTQGAGSCFITRRIQSQDREVKTRKEDLVSERTLSEGSRAAQGSSCLSCVGKVVYAV